MAAYGCGIVVDCVLSYAQCDNSVAAGLVAYVTGFLSGWFRGKNSPSRTFRTFVSRQTGGGDVGGAFFRI